MTITCKPDTRQNPFDTTYEKGAVFALSDGKIIYATGQAYREGTEEAPYYCADAHLSTDNFAHARTIEIKWECRSGWKTLDAASDHCDWDKPVSITHCALGELI